MNSTNFLQQLFGLDGQTAIVIGGTGVLGGALSEGLAQAGARVIVAGRSESRGQSRVDQITQLHGEAMFQSVDVTSRDSLQRLCDRARQEWNGTDILVNCFGVNSATRYEEVDESDWHRVIDGNLTATHLACQIFAPAMADAGGGAILNIGSVTSHLPLSRVFAYSASKAAVVNLTQNLAREYASRQVRINVLCPGFFPAEQNRRILDDQRVAQIMEQTPMGRFGEPQELVGAALLLVSQRAGSFVTGEDLYVDGGFTAMRF
ncbi:MAG: gluconate 5-dehydrogenase [Planctomycetaceae bacterium]|nr:gluconate 5-dehydrogenase [Planctomycetaceae bacterium]